MDPVVFLAPGDRRDLVEEPLAHLHHPPVLLPLVHVQSDLAELPKQLVPRVGQFPRQFRLLFSPHQNVHANLVILGQEILEAAHVFAITTLSGKFRCDEDKSLLLLDELLFDANAVVGFLASQQTSLEDLAEIVDVLVHGELLLDHSVVERFEEFRVYVGDGHRLVEVTEEPEVGFHWSYLREDCARDESCSIPRGTSRGGTFIFPGGHSKRQQIDHRKTEYLKNSAGCLAVHFRFRRSARLDFEEHLCASVIFPRFIPRFIQPQLFTCRSFTCDALKEQNERGERQLATRVSPRMKAADGQHLIKTF